jgi:acetyl-CoA carboxylase / biotin carboxylase 1
MKSKGVIRKQVQWAESRAFFFWRLKRRLAEFELAQALSTAPKKGFRKEALEDLHRWFLSAGGSADIWDDDRQTLAWFESHSAQVTDYVSGKRSGLVSADLGSKLAELASADSAGVLKAALAGLPAEQKALLLKALQESI